MSLPRIFGLSVPLSSCSPCPPKAWVMRLGLSHQCSSLSYDHRTITRPHNPLYVLYILVTYLVIPTGTQVQVSVAYSDYRQDGEVISRVAEIQFKLLQTNENCSFTQTCDFESSPCVLELGSGVSVMNSSSSPLSSLTGTSGQ